MIRQVVIEHGVIESGPMVTFWHGAIPRKYAPSVASLGRLSVAMDLGKIYVFYYSKLPVIIMQRKAEGE